MYGVYQTASVNPVISAVKLICHLAVNVNQSWWRICACFELFNLILLSKSSGWSSSKVLQALPSGFENNIIVVICNVYSQANLCFGGKFELFLEGNIFSCESEIFKFQLKSTFMVFIAKQVELSTIQQCHTTSMPTMACIIDAEAPLRQVAKVLIGIISMFLKIESYRKNITQKCMRRPIKLLLR